MPACALAGPVEGQLDSSTEWECRSVSSMCANLDHISEYLSLSFLNVAMVTLGRPVSLQGDDQCRLYSQYWMGVIALLPSKGDVST